MSYSVQQLKADLVGVLHGTTINQIQNIDGVIERAARQLLLDIDPNETIRITQFSTPVFNTIFDYAVASDLKGTRLIDIYPQVRRLPRDIWTQAYNQAFDVAKENIFNSLNMFTVNFNTGIRTIRINAPFLNPPVIINQAESLTSNGTWSASGTASNLSVDNVNYVQGAGSLTFDVTNGAALITNSTMGAVDLTAHLNQSSLFTYVYVPTGATLTSVTLKWGSSASAYYSKTVTVNQDNVPFVNGWNTCKFDWASASTTGSPTVSAVNYIQVTLNVTGSMSGCKVNGINSILGTILDYEYYSTCLFRNSSTGAFQETISDDADLINLGVESYNLLLNKTAEFSAQQQQGVDAAGDSVYFKAQYEAGVKKYNLLYRSQVQNHRLLIIERQTCRTGDLLEEDLTTKTMKMKTALKKIEDTKADRAHHKKGVKEGSKKDTKVDKALAKKLIKKSK